jgi:hypothetical protein
MTNAYVTAGVDVSCVLTIAAGIVEAIASDTATKEAADAMKKSGGTAQARLFHDNFTAPLFAPLRAVDAVRRKLVLETAKKAFGYDGQDDKAKGSFRQYVMRLNYVLDNGAALNDDDVAALGRSYDEAEVTTINTIYKALQKPEAEQKKADRKAEKELMAEIERQDAIDFALKEAGLAAASATRVIGHGEMADILTAWLNEKPELSETETQSVANLYGAIVKLMEVEAPAKAKKAA